MTQGWDASMHSPHSADYERAEPRGGSPSDLNASFRKWPTLSQKQRTAHRCTMFPHAIIRTRECKYFPCLSGT